jgi:hypothetical protein
MLYFLWRSRQTRAFAASLLRFLDHTQSHTPGRTPPNEQSARRRVHNLHSTQQTQETNIHALSGFEHATSEIKRMLTYTLHPTATGMGYVVILLYYRLSFLACVGYCLVIISRCDIWCVCVCLLWSFICPLKTALNSTYVDYINYSFDWENKKPYEEWTCNKQSQLMSFNQFLLNFLVVLVTYNTL